jgi:hypothetical protein
LRQPLADQRTRSLTTIVVNCTTTFLTFLVLYAIVSNQLTRPSTLTAIIAGFAINITLYVIACYYRYKLR